MKKRLVWLVCAIGIHAVLYSQGRADIVITELMADPSPQAGLPSNEWIELKNRTQQPVNLQNFRLCDASGQSGAFPLFLLQPDSIVIVCASTAVAAMSTFGKTIGVTSFPSLDNEGDLVYIKNSQGKVVHAIRYNTNWYRNAVKKEGGWSLEMIDPSYPCGGESNWNASNDPSGGTPGKVNSRNGSNMDTHAPVAIRSWSPDSLTIVLLFNEPLDSLSAAAPQHYKIDPSLPIQQVMVSPPLFDEIILKLSSPQQKEKVYKVSVRNIPDCAGNQDSDGNAIKAGLAQLALEHDCIINEILFNPRSGGYDYVEVMNTGKKIIDLSQIQIASYNTSGTLSTPKALTGTSWQLYPGEWIVCTESPVVLQHDYYVKNPGSVLQLALPSLPDDAGKVILLNSQGDRIDSVPYLDDWHFALIDHAEGVALERIDPYKPGHLATNWQSASGSSGYGTPTAENSQHFITNEQQGMIWLNNSMFSPDNDGREDFLQIEYRMQSAGFIANLNIFDMSGARVCSVVKNELLGEKGSWKWDGLDDRKNPLPVGVYLVITELFNLQGQRKYFKHAVVIARPLR